MGNLTSRQQEILQYIKQQIQECGSPPTRAEIAKYMGFKSANAAEDHLRALARKRAIELVSGTSRGIRVLGESGIPVVGKVAAGHPIMAIENIDRHYNMDTNIFNKHVDYLLEVNGDSMKNIGIMDGDLLAVHSCSHAESGQVVVARIDEEVTVKRLKKYNNQISLLPENDDYAEINITDDKKDNFSIEGLAIGVIRSKI